MADYPITAVFKAIGGDRLIDTFRNISDNAERVKTAGQKMGSVGDTLTSKITKPAVIATTAAAGLVGALGFKRLVGMDSAQAKLKGLGYDAKSVERISKQVETAIDGGMTTMAEGVDIAAGALAAGVKEGAELEKYIQLVGDAAVGANRPVDEMAMIFNRVQGSGKLMTQELNMIEQSMPGFAQAMADNVAGGSMEAFREMVTNGEVGSKDFLKVMDGFAGGMAEAYSESWAGMTKNVLAYVGIIGEALLDGLFKDGKKGLANFIEVLKSDEVMEWAQRTGEKISQVSKSIINAVKDIKSWWDDLSPSVQKFIGVISGVGAVGLVALGPILKFASIIATAMPVIVSIFKVLGVVIGALTSPIGLVVAAIVAAAALIYVYWEPIKDFFIDLWESIKKAGLLIWKNLQEGWADAVENLKSAWEGIKVFFTILWEFIKQIFIGVWEGIKAVWTSSVEFLQDAWSSIKEFFTGIWNFIKESGLLIWENLKEGWANAVENLKEAWASTKEFFFNLWESIADIFKSAGEWIVEILQSAYDFMNNITGGAFGTYVDLIKSYLTTAKEIIKAVWSYIKDTFSNALDFIKALVTGDFQGMKDAMKNQMNSAKNLLKNIWSAIKNNIGAKIGEILSNVIAKFIEIKNNIQNKINEAKTALVNKFSEMVSSTRQKAQEIVQAGREKFNEFKNAVRDKLTEAVSIVGQKISEMPGKVMEFAGNMLAAGMNLVQGLIRGIKNMAGAAIDAITGVVDGVVGKAKSLLKIKSPSRLFRSFGGFLPKGLAIGIDKMKSVATKASERLGLGVENAFKPQLAMDGLDVAGRVNDINRQAERKLSHTFDSSIDVGSQKQPAYINLNLGGRDYEVFVDDITSVQDRKDLIRKSFA